MFPIALQAPWGVSPALLPEIPLPTKIRTAFQDPIAPDCDPSRAEDEQYVESKYREVCASIQDGMDALARRRAGAACHCSADGARRAGAGRARRRP